MIRVPIRKNAKWLQALHEELSSDSSPISTIKWRPDYTYHQTLVFIYDEHCVRKMCHEFPKVLASHGPIHMFFDKIDAFTAGNGKEHVVCLTSTKPSPMMHDLANDVRVVVARMGIKYDDRPFKLHITLCKIPVAEISLDALQSMISKISLPKFDCRLDDVQYLYKGETDPIEKWCLINKAIHKIPYR